jgi:PKD repeat protein
MRGLKVYTIVGVSLVIISLFASCANVGMVTSETNVLKEKEIFLEEQNENIKLVSAGGLLSTQKSQAHVNTQTIEFLYPKTGYFYNRNTVGRYSALLNMLQSSFWIGGSLESGVQTTGSVDEVTFTLTLDGAEVNTQTDTTSENGKFTCKFYGVYNLFGVYEVTAVGYYQDSEVCRKTVDKVIFFKLGTGSNKNPIAVANFDKIVWETKEVQFDASASYDSDGTIVSYLWNFGDGHTSEEMNPTHIYETPGEHDVWLYVTDNEGGQGTDNAEITVLAYDLGVWIVTNYDGNTHAVKLDFEIDDLIWMLHQGGGARNYHLTMQNEEDTLIHLHFGKTTLNGIPAIMTTFQVEIDGDTDTSKEYEVGLEFRFPYSLLWPNQDPSEEYFAARVAYHYLGDNPGKYGPHDVHTWFYFGKQSLSDPGILRMKIDPYPYGVEKLVPLTYEASLLTVDEYENEQFNRQLAVEFDPAAELTITSVPLEGKISYYFGDETAGETTTISFTSTGTLFSNIIQRFILDPLPSYMHFDLTILGARSFLYTASDSYDLTYIVESVQNGNIVKLELDDIPTRILVSWGLDISIVGETASGFVDLDMSSNLGNVKLYLYGGSDPFIEMNNFPRKLRVEGSINVPALSGYVSVSKYSGGTTTIAVPISYDKWDIDATLMINDGSATAEFNLPDSSSNYVMFGLDTNQNSFLGWMFSLTDTTTGDEVIEFNVDGIATDNFKVSWNNNNGQVENFKIQGKITKFINLGLSVDYQSADLDITGSWELFEGGSFLFELNKPVEVTFVDIESSSFKLYGSISLYGNRKLSISWELIEGYTGNPAGNGWFQIYTFGQPIGDELHLDFEYAPDDDWNYQYGFRLDGDDFMEITRTIAWQTDNRIIPRIWILGDVPLPGNWEMQVLWKGDWYPVPFDE